MSICWREVHGRDWIRGSSPKLGHCLGLMVRTGQARGRERVYSRDMPPYSIPKCFLGFQAKEIFCLCLLLGPKETVNGTQHCQPAPVLCAHQCIVRPLSCQQLHRALSPGNTTVTAWGHPVHNKQPHAEKLKSFLCPMITVITKILLHAQ